MLDCHRTDVRKWWVSTCVVFATYVDRNKQHVTPEEECIAAEGHEGRLEENRKGNRKELWIEGII